MKIIIPSKGRSNTISTHKLFEGTNIEYKIVLHNNGEREKYSRNKSISPESLVVTNIPNSNISLERAWIIDNLIEKDEWFIMMDDNIKAITAVSKGYYDREEIPQREAIVQNYNNSISIKKFLELAKEDIKRAEKIGAKYCGFALVDNPFFRKKKYREVGFIITKMVLIKKSGINFNPNLPVKEDYGFTADNLLQFGCVLINNYIHPVSKFYQKGGVGSLKDRTPDYIKCAEYLMKTYPGLFSYNQKKGHAPFSEVKIRFTNIKQLNQWRVFMGK